MDYVLIGLEVVWNSVLGKRLSLSSPLLSLRTSESQFAPARERPCQRRKLRPSPISSGLYFASSFQFHSPPSCSFSLFLEILPAMASLAGRFSAGSGSASVGGAAQRCLSSLESAFRVPTGRFPF